MGLFYRYTIHNSLYSNIRNHYNLFSCYHLQYNYIIYIAITEKGPLIVEGNNGPGFDLVQVVLNKGTKYMLEKIDNKLVK